MSLVTLIDTDQLGGYQTSHQPLIMAIGGMIYITNEEESLLPERYLPDG